MDYTQLNEIVPNMWALSRTLDDVEKEAHLGFMNIDNILPCPAFNIYDVKDGNMSSSMCEFTKIIGDIQLKTFKYQKELDAMLIYASFTCNFVGGCCSDMVQRGPGGKKKFTDDKKFIWKALLNRKDAFVLIVSMIARMRSHPLSANTIATLHPAALLTQFEVRWETESTTAIYRVPSSDKRIISFAYHMDINMDRLMTYLGPNVTRSQVLGIILSFRSIDPLERAIALNCIIIPTRTAAEDNSPYQIDPVEHGLVIVKATSSDEAFGPGTNVFEINTKEKDNKQKI